MSSRTIPFSHGEYYHIYNRGTDGRVIFEDKYDYERFLALLKVLNGIKPVDLKLQGRTLYERLEVDVGEPIISILGYVLMPNHYHLLLTPITDKGISTFMQKLGTAYTMYFNSKNERSGNLFQGKFKAKHVNDDVYLQYLLSYIHLNPIKLIQSDWKEKGINNLKVAKKHLEQYTYSSFLDYAGSKRPENCLVDTSLFPTELESSDNFKSATKHWLQGLAL